MDTKIISGIYCIENILNNKKYIGSSVNILPRKRAHFCDLRKNRHGSGHLQNAFNKYGEKNFIWYLIEECNEKNLFFYEKYWIEFLNCFNRSFGYNVREPQMSSHLSEEHKYKISLGNTGKIRTQAMKEIQRTTHLGKRASLNTKKQMSISQIKVRGREIIQYNKDGTYVKKYNCIRRASIKTNISETGICECCRGHINKKGYKRFSAGGYIWKYIGGEKTCV